jgi:hypothetical protein
MNDLDARIRAAVTELAEAAPTPKPLPTNSPDATRSYRWLAVAAASVLIVTGVVAIATWRSTGDDTTPLDTVVTSTPGETLPPPPTTDVITPVTTAPNGIARTIPVGGIAARPGDVLAVDGSGALVLIGVDGDDLAPPVMLLDAPADPSSQRIQVAGLVDGTVLYGADDGTTRTVMALTAPGAAPIDLARSSGGPWLSPDGAQWAFVDPSSGRLVIRRTDGAPGTTIDSGGGIGSVAWRPDGASLYVAESDGPLSWLWRYEVDEGYRLAGKIERFRQGTRIAGFDGSGNLVVSGFSQADESTVVTTFAPDSLETVDGLWDRTISATITQLALSPDGSRLMTVDGTGGAVIDGLDGSTVRLDDVSAAWFAGAATTGAPTPAQEPGVVVDGPVVAIPAADAQMAGIVSGVLAYDGTCLSLLEPSTGGAAPALWRAGTTWDPDQLVVVLPDGQRVAIGDRLETGGGYVDVASMSVSAVREAILPCTEAIGPVVGVIQGAETVTPRAFEVSAGEAEPLAPGTISAGRDDVLAVRPDGDLWLYPGLLAATSGETPDPLRVYDLASPDATLPEGEDGPSPVDTVAGVLEGNVIFGVCCEPVSGMTMAVPDIDGATRLAVLGSRPTIHPSRPLIATISSTGLTVADLGTGTTTTASFLDDVTSVRAEVTWAGADGEALVVVGWDRFGWFVERFDASDLSHRTHVRRLAVASPLSSSGPADAAIAGTVGGNVVLRVAEPDRTHLVVVDPDVLTTEESAVTLPAGVLVVRVLGDRIVWLADGALTTIGSDGEPTVSARLDAIDVWFASPSVPPIG